MNSFALLFLILAIWQCNTFCIPAFLSVIFTMVVTLNFILFIALIFNTYIKLTWIKGVFINFLILIFTIFLRIIFRIYYFLAFSCFFFLWPLYCFCVFLLIFYKFLVCFLIILTITTYHQVVYFRVHTDNDKNGYCLQSNNNNSLNDLWLLFANVLQHFIHLNITSDY